MTFNGRQPQNIQSGISQPCCIKLRQVLSRRAKMRKNVPKEAKGIKKEPKLREPMKAI